MLHLTPGKQNLLKFQELQNQAQSNVESIEKEQTPNSVTVFFILLASIFGLWLKH